MTVAVVTDSTADISLALARELGITIVPLNVHFGDVALLDRVELSEEEFYQRLESDREPPITSPPAVQAFIEVYSRLAENVSEIVSIHVSSRLSTTSTNAERAKIVLAGRCRITVIDSQSASIGLGLMVQLAARAARSGANARQITHLVHGMILRTHVLFFLDKPEYLRRSGRAQEAQSQLEDAPNLKPVLKLEDGMVQPVENVRTRAKALERLYEFVEDAPHVAELAVLYCNTPEETETLLKRIAPLFPRERVLLSRYGPGLATHVGPGAMGVAVYEGEPNGGSPS